MPSALVHGLDVLGAGCWLDVFIRFWRNEAVVAQAYTRKRRKRPKTSKGSRVYLLDYKKNLTKTDPRGKLLFTSIQSDEFSIVTVWRFLPSCIVYFYLNQSDEFYFVTVWWFLPSCSAYFYLNQPDNFCLVTVWWFLPWSVLMIFSFIQCEILTQSILMNFILLQSDDFYLHLQWIQSRDWSSLLFFTLMKSDDCYLDPVW